MRRGERVTKIGPKEFVDSRRQQRLDLNAIKRDPELMQKLKAAGIKPEDLDKLDVIDPDGHIDGVRELRQLHYLLKSKQRDTDPETLTVKASGWAATPIDHVYEALEARWEPSPKKEAPLPAVGPKSRERFPLKGAVGPGERNAADDVRLVQTRLKSLGFPLAVTGRFGPELENVLRSYRSMLLGTDFTKEEPGVVKPDDVVDHALASSSPPRWEQMPRSGTGFVNDDVDNYDFGSAEAKALLLEAGETYAKAYLSSHPNAAKLSLNDVSLKQGGANRGHETHQNGLDLDFRLPRQDGTVGSDVRWVNYDREATWAMLQALADHPRVERVLFSDPQLLSRARQSKHAWASKLFDGGSVHQNHIHVDVKPPVVTPQTQ